MKRRRADRSLNVTFAPSPPSSPRRVRFAEVTQIRRDTTDVCSVLTNRARAPANREQYEYGQKPPSAQKLASTIDDHGIPNKVYQEVYYSKEADVPDQAKEYAGILFRIRGGTGISALEEWGGEDKISIPGLLQRKKGPFRLPKIVGIEGWEYNQSPPPGREIRSWLLEDSIRTRPRDRRDTWASQVIY